MSSRNTRQQDEPRGTPVYRSRNTRSNVDENRDRIRTSTESSNNSRVSGRSARQGKSVFTFVEGRNPLISSDADLLLRGSRGEVVSQTRRARGGDRQLSSPQPLARRSTPRPERTRRRLTTDNGTDTAPLGFGESSSQSMQSTYMRNLLTNRTRIARTSSRPTGILDRINRRSSSSSGDGQSDPATYFTLVEMESSKNIQSSAAVLRGNTESQRVEPSESNYAALQVSEFKETINKLDEVPEWFQHSDGFPPNPPATPRTAESSSIIKTKMVDRLQTEKKSLSTASDTYSPQKNLDPQELMKKLIEISENRRTYYVQNTESADSLMEMYDRSPQRHSIDSMLSLPMNMGREVTPSTRALAGSMTTLKFIELSKRKPASVLNALQPNDRGDEPSVSRVKKCETFVPPVDAYKNDMIINVPINPLSPVEPHETVDGPSVEFVIMTNQICDELDSIFKGLHIGFDASQEQIKAEDAYEQERTRSQKTELEEQIVSELRASFFPHLQTEQRSADSKRSNQSIGSWQSKGSYLGDLQQTISQPSTTSLPHDLQLTTKELTEILNQKYEKSTNSGSLTRQSSDGDLKIIYSSCSSALKRQISDKKLDTLPDADTASSALKPDRVGSLHSDFSKHSINKSSLRRFTAKVQIQTIEGSNPSLGGESAKMKAAGGGIQNDIQPLQSQQSQRAQSAMSLVSTGTVTSSKIREAERTAIEEMIQEGFGTMKLDTIYTDPYGYTETRSQSELFGVLEKYKDVADIEAASCDIFVGDPNLMVETGTTKQLMLHQAKFPTECDEHSSAHKLHNSAKNKNSGSKKTISSTESWPKEQKINEQEEADEQSDVECKEWVKFKPGSNEEEKGKDSEEEEEAEQNEVTELVVDPEELSLLFPFAFRLSPNSSWWKRSRFSGDYRNPITKEKAPEFDDLRDQLKALLEEYEGNYTRFETVYRWGDPGNPPKWNKKYRSPFLRPNVVDNQDPNRFHLSDDALSMKGSKDCKDPHSQQPGYSTATYYMEPTKWWNLANVRRYVLRKELAKHSFEHHRTRLGLRARPSKFSASLILGCKKRRSRKSGLVCRRNKDTNKILIDMFMKKNLPRSVWKELKTKYQVATSLRYRQRHHWNPFHPSNRPSIDGATRLGWYGQSLMRRSNITYLGQFAKGEDHKLQAEVREIKESEIREKWLRDIMEIAYVAYCTNKLITEELQFLIMIGVWLGIVIDEFAYFMRFVIGELSKGSTKKTLYEKKHPKKTKHCNHSEWLRGTEEKNPLIWEKILKVCDKTLFMLKRGLLPVAENDQTDQKDADSEDQPSVEKHIECDLSLPWYENTKLRKTNRRLLDSIALAYPDYHYLASKTNKYYHVELDADEARWFPIRYYDADKAEYNFISHDHPKWPDWKFLHMTSYGDSFGMSPVTFTPYKAKDSEEQSYSLSDEDLDDDNQIQDYKDTGSVRLVSAQRDSRVSEKKRVLILMLMRECFDDEGNFRYILVNPIKFDRKRITMSMKTIGKTTTQMCTDPNAVGLEDYTTQFMRKSELKDEYIKLDPEKFGRLLKKYAAQGESPRSFTERRIDIALDYWYQKAAQVNHLMKGVSFKINAVDRIIRFAESHREQEPLLVFEDPNALKFQNEPIWNKRILENFQHACSGHKNCEEEEFLISRSSQSSSCSDSSETEDNETSVDRLPSDFLKVMHTYFSLTTIETLKKESFIPFPIPLETLYCYERMKTGNGAKPRKKAYNRMSLRGRISERHRIRVARRNELNKIRDQKDIGGHHGEGDGEHARCMGHEDDPRTHIGFKSKCPICHKMLISHHPSLTLFMEFKTKHMHSHRMDTERIKPPKKTGTIKYQGPHAAGSSVHSPHVHNHKGKDGAKTHDDCYLHCRVPTILSIFQGKSVTKNKQEKLIRYFNRALHYEHAAIKDEITTRLNQETDELDFLKYKQEYFRVLHDEICERTVCPIISQQIQALLTNQELLNDLYICWLDAYSRGAGILSSLAPHIRSHKVYLPDNIGTNLFDLLIKVLKRMEGGRPTEATDTSKGSETVELSPFDLWFEDFVARGLLPCYSSTLDARDTEAKDMSWISSCYNLLDRSEQSISKRGYGVHDDAFSEYIHPDHTERHHDPSSEDSFEVNASSGRLIDVSPSEFTPDSDLD